MSLVCSGVGGACGVTGCGAGGCTAAVGAVVWPRLLWVVGLPWWSLVLPVPLCRLLGVVICGVVARVALGESWRQAALALVEALRARGLVAEVWGHGAVRVRNPAGEPDSDDPRGQAFAPGLRQEVLCRPRGGVLWWWWVWSGVTRSSPPDLEPLCPVTEVTLAADRIARVLAVPFAGAPASGAPASDGSGSDASGGGV